MKFFEKFLQFLKQKLTPSDKAPNDPKVWMYSGFLSFSKLPIIKYFEKVVRMVFIEVAPSVPISLKHTFSGTKGLNAAVIGFVLTLIFCFVINAGGAYLNGTLFPTDETIDNNVRTFVEDKWNLLLYTLVCPIYVSLTAWLVVVVIKGWGEIKEFNNNLVGKKDTSTFPTFKAILLGLLILTVAFGLTTSYINGITEYSEKENIYYWFFTKKNGSFTLGALGIYYFLLNYSLLIVTLIALTFFMSIYSMMMGVGKTLEGKTSIDEVNFDKLKVKLSAFTEAYILAKLLVGTYIINIMIWIDSPLGNGVSQINIKIAIILMGLLGVFMISIPRYFVELQWYRLKNRSNTEGSIDVEYEDIRSFEVKFIATVLDTLLIGGFIISYSKYLFS